MFGLLNVGNEGLPRHVRFKGNRRHFPGNSDRMMLGWLFEQRDQPLDLADRAFVGLGRAGGILQHRIDQHGNRLRHPIENQ